MPHNSRLVATTSSAAVPKSLPVFSDRLGAWIERSRPDHVTAIQGFDGYTLRISRQTATRAMVEEAKSSLPFFQEAAAGATAELLAAWLRPLALVVRNPPSAETLPGIARAFAAVLSDIPGAAFTAETSRRAAQKFEFWPSAADVVQLLQPEIDDIRRIGADLRTLCDPGYQTAEDLRAVLKKQEELDAEQHRRRKNEYAEGIRDRIARGKEIGAALGTQGASLPLDPEHLKMLRDTDPLIQAARNAAKDDWNVEFQ